MNYLALPLPSMLGTARAASLPLYIEPVDHTGVLSLTTLPL